ncbi:MAG: hypothetical protein OHK0029_32890 [Armatimonadaceae bacterium]
MSTKTETAKSGEAAASNAQEFFKGVMHELRLAEWPKREELIRLTQVVLTLIAIVAIYCGGLDFILSLITSRLLGR